MISKDQARIKVQEFLLAEAPTRAKDWLVHEQTLDKPYGWVFFYDHRKVIEEQNKRSRLAGNGPILVLKETGQIHQFGTAGTLDFYLGRIEKLLEQKRSDGK